MDTHQISAEHLPMNNTHYTAERELLLPMCVSVLNENGRHVLVRRAPWQFHGHVIIFLKHY